MSQRILTYSNIIIKEENYVLKKFSSIENYKNEYIANEYVKRLGIAPKLIEFNDVSLELKYERIQGMELSKNKSYIFEKSFINEMVRIFSALHTICYSGKVGYLFESNSQNIHKYMEEKLYNRLHSITTFSTFQKKQIVKFFENNKPILKGCSENFFLHYDLKPSNILIDSNGLKLIDFDKSSFGNPYMDFSKFYWRTLNFNQDIAQKILGELNFDFNIEIIKFFLILHMVGAVSFYDAVISNNKTKFFKYVKEAYNFILETTKC